VDNDKSPKGENFAKNSQLGSWWTVMRETFELHQERKKDEVMVTRIGGMHGIKYMHHICHDSKNSILCKSYAYIKVN
jgi:hypothetical protein